MMEIINEAVGKGLEMAMNDMVNDMVKNCPADEGFTRNTIRGEVRGNVIILYAGGAMEYIEFGTPPHEIRPKDKKALYWEGAEHPVKRVKHPGTRPNPVMRNAIHRGITDYIPNRIRQALEGIGG